MDISGHKVLRTAAALLLVAVFNPGARALEVADANGGVVGPVVGFADPGIGLIDVPRVALTTVDGRVLTLLVGTDRFLSNAVVLYDTPDCSSQAYVVDTGTISPLLPAAVLPPGNTLYRPATDGSTRDITARALQVMEAGCQSLAPGQEFQVPGALPLEPVVDLLDRFSPPFAVRTDSAAQEVLNVLP